MVLTKSERKVLQKQFGDGYLSKCLEDIALNRHNSESIGCLHTTDEIFIGDEIVNEALLKKAWNRVSATLKEFYNITSDTLKSIAWKTVVTIGNVPAFFQPLISSLEKIITASGQRIFTLLATITKYMGDLWEYISNIFFKENIELTKSQKEAVSAAQTESFNFYSLAKSTGNIFKTIIRKLAAGVLSVLNGVKDVILKGVNFMTMNYYNILDSMYDYSLDNDDDKTKEHVAKSGLMLFLSNLSTINYSLTRREFVEAFGRKLSKMVNTSQKLASSISINTLGPYFKAGWLYNAFDFVKNSVGWLLTYLPWLTNTLRRLVDSSFSAFITLIQVSPLFGKVFGKWITDVFNSFEKENKFSNDYFDLKETIDKLSKDNQNVPGHIRKELKEALNATNIISEEMTEFNMLETSDKIGASDKQFFSTIDKTVDVLTDLYLERDPDLDILDQVIQENTGYDIRNFIGLLSSTKSMLNISLLRAISAIYNVKEQKLTRFEEFGLGENIGGNNNGGKKTVKKLKKEKKEILDRLDVLKEERANLETKFKFASDALKEAEAIFNKKRTAAYKEKILRYRDLRKKIVKREKEQGLVPYKILDEKTDVLQAIASVEEFSGGSKDVEDILNSFLDIGEQINDINQRIKEIEKELGIKEKDIKERRKVLKKYHFMLTAFTLLFAAGSIFGVFYTYGLIPWTTPWEMKQPLPEEPEPEIEKSFFERMYDVIAKTEPVAKATGVVDDPLKDAFDMTKWLDPTGFLTVPLLPSLYLVLEGAGGIVTKILGLIFSTISIISWIIVEQYYEGRGLYKAGRELTKLKNEGWDIIYKVVKDLANLGSGLMTARLARIENAITIGGSLFFGGVMGLPQVGSRLKTMYTKPYEMILERAERLKVEKDLKRIKQKKPVKEYVTTDVIILALEESPSQDYLNTIERIKRLASQRRIELLEEEKGKGEEEEEEEEFDPSQFRPLE